MNKKKVGIITSYLDFNKNYGGILQAYALSSLITQLGYDTYIMPYVYEFIEEGKSDLLHKAYRFGIKQIRKITNPQFRNQQFFYDNMLKFVNKELPIYRESRIRVNELKEISSDFYAFVSGSDQVWSTKLQNNHCDPGMFLSFVPQGVKKIAYAPSLGSTLEMNAITAYEFKQAVCGYDSISSREKLGKDLIERITGREAPMVLDPTLLYDRENWYKFISVPDNLPKDYILLYRFGNMKSTDLAIKIFEEKYKYPIIELPSSAVSINDHYNKRYDINPACFLGLIKNARLVLTDSFHCTVFCILMKTQFFTFYRQEPSQSSNMNGRLDDLLKLTNLESRLVKPNNTILYDRISEQQFEYAHKCIDQEKAFSLDYLKSALEHE